MVLNRGGADVAVLLVEKAEACGFAYVDSWRYAHNRNLVIIIVGLMRN